VKSHATNLFLAVVIVAAGLALAAGGIYVGETDDAPGAALLGIVAALGAIVLAVKTARRKPERS
jgi:hypothetical protein